ncbi:MAG: MATE family efflux transporter, partial [Oscillospiraceae bacterium]
MNSTAINKKDNIDCKALKNQKLATMPIRKLFFQMSIPTLLAQVVNLLYNIVDRVYVGRIQETNGLALAGLGVAFPIVLLVAAFAAFVGMGGAPRAAIAMGDNDNEKAQKLLGNSVTLIFIFSIGLSLIFYFIKDPVLLLFGASEASLPYASDYLGIYLLGTPFVMLALGLNPFITNQGFTKFSMITIVVGCALNIILDPIFIFVLNLGVKGAAIATVISQCVSAILTVWFFFTKKSTLKIKPKYLKLSSLIIGSILSLGVSTFIMQATECLIQLVFNAGMKTYGNDDYVAIM